MMQAFIDKHLSNGGKVANKKAKRTALQKISKEMAPTDQESYHDNFGVHQNTTQYMDEGGAVSEGDEITSWHDPATANLLHQVQGNSPKTAALQQMTGNASSAASKWNDPDYIKQRAMQAAQQQPQQATSNTDAQGYSTYKKATSDYADGGSVTDDDSSPSDGDNSSIDFNLSDEDKQALSDYLDADKQKQARANAINQFIQDTPESKEMLNKMVMGMSPIGGIENLGEEAISAAAPGIVQKVKQIAPEVIEDAVNPAVQKLKSYFSDDSGVSPELLNKIQNLKQNPKQMIETQGPMDMDKLQKLRDLMGLTGPIKPR